MGSYWTVANSRIHRLRRIWLGLKLIIYGNAFRNSNVNSRAARICNEAYR
jgi:hypothetical protein